VDLPVGSTRLTELTGSIERVHDPDPIGIETSGVLEAFFRQHCVGGSMPAELILDESLCGGITAIHHLPRSEPSPLEMVTQLDQSSSGLCREAQRQVGI
jgi:hypothetical protein